MNKWPGSCNSARIFHEENSIEIMTDKQTCHTTETAFSFMWRSPINMACFPYDWCAFRSTRSLSILSNGGRPSLCINPHTLSTTFSWRLSSLKYLSGLKINLLLDWLGVGMQEITTLSTDSQLHLFINVIHYLLFITKSSSNSGIGRIFPE